MGWRIVYALEWAIIALIIFTLVFGVFAYFIGRRKWRQTRWP